MVVAGATREGGFGEGSGNGVGVVASLESRSGSGKEIGGVGAFSVTGTSWFLREG